MDEIIIYEKPTCSKCRVAISLTNEHGVPYRTVRYHETPLTKRKLAELVTKIGIRPIELLRTEDPQFKTLNLNRASISDEEALDLMVTYPDLMQRPILERGDTAIVGRPTERVIEFLES